MNIISNCDDWLNPIDIMPLNQAFPQLQEIENIPGASEFKQFKSKKVVLSENHERLFGVFSSRSVTIPHQDAVSIVNDALVNIYGSEPEIKLTSMKEGAQIVAEFNLEGEKPIDIGNNDKSTFNLLLSNSYDKALPFKLQMGVMRLVCTNGMVLGDTLASIKSSELLDGWNAQALQRKVENLTENSRSVVGLWKKWVNVQVEHAIAQATLENKFPKVMIEPILDPQNYPCSKWELYNMMTARSTHDSRTERARLSFDRMISRIFYGSNTPLYEAEKAQLIDNSEVSETVTETEEIYHL